MSVTVVRQPTTSLTISTGNEVAQAEFDALAADVTRLNDNIFYPEDYGATGNDAGHDDTVGIQGAIDAALACDGYGIVKLDPAKTYYCNADPRTDRHGNSILSIVDVSDGSKPIVIFGASHRQSWDGQQATIKCTRTGDSYSATYGPPSVLGGATDENGRGGYQWCGPVTLAGFKIELPLNAAIAGIDGLSFGGYDFYVNVVAGDGISATTPNSNKHAFGIRLPGIRGYNHAYLRGCCVLQMYVGYVLTATDHTWMANPIAYKCKLGIGLQTPFKGNHVGVGLEASIERCPNVLAGWTPTAGLTNPTVSGVDRGFFNPLCLDVEMADGLEDPSFNLSLMILDPFSVLQGTARIHLVSAAGVRNDIGTVFALGLRLERVGTSPPPATPSAAEVTLPPSESLVKISGSTTITSITASVAAREVTLIFTGTAQITDGGNLKLAGGFTGAAGRVLRLVCDGTDWYEISRATT